LPKRLEHHPPEVFHLRQLAHQCKRTTRLPVAVPIAMIIPFIAKPT
jgi:hypothetical protein